MIKINNSSTSNMESLALSPEIQSLKDMLDGISTANQSTLNALGGTLTTVMGTAVTTGAPTAADMLAILEAADILPKQNRAGNALQAGESYDRGMILTKLSELITAQATAFKWLRSKLNISDLFTKAVPRQVFEALVGGLTGFDGPEHLARILEEMH